MNPTVPETGNDGVPVRAVSRAVALLVALTDGPRTLGHLAAATGLSKTTAFRLLGTLAGSYLVVQDPKGGMYSLGPGCFQFLEALSSPGNGLEIVARPELERLRVETEETAALHVRVGGQRICVTELPSARPIRYIAGIGVAEPVHAGSAGKVLLAWLNPDDLEHLLDRITLVPRTSATITNREVLMGELAEVRERGWALSHGERIDGAVGVSVPVRDAAGGVLASLSVIGPAARLTDQRAEEVLPEVLATAERITQRLVALGDTRQPVAG
ncbi:hypothetical protein GCM10023321_11020 [Pseudonocardia eucalypti]|uniref:IclR family transcriptional regulator n=1 Tax=Pseudonocardia eucalypti TaxID=648755 RepID=A0ABP9PML0_9PSEU|nr:DNA-binding IclR family transcriptional regulator [Pseudonocardia eucalypti]